ncbi:MAG: alpha/beta hydrolase [Pseudomonadota bacterium]
METAKVVDGAPLAVRDLGKLDGGRVFVIWPSIFSTAAAFHELANRLAAHGRVFAIDPPGHGQSPLLSEMTMQNCATATLRTLDLLGVRNFVWIGTSWGGLVGIETARLAPERFEKLICLNTPVSFEGQTLSSRFIMTMALLAGPTRFFAKRVAETFFLPKTRRSVLRRQAMDAFGRGLANNSRRELFGAANLVFKTRTDSWSALASVDVDTTLVAGEFDGMYAAAQQQQKSEGIDHLTFCTLPTAHISAVDEPDMTTKIILEILKE